MTIHQYTIHVPTQFNSGKPVPNITLEEFLQEALRLFGGYTVARQVVGGAWLSGDTAYIEPMLKLDIATDNYEVLKGYVQHMKAVYKQEAMYVVRTGEVSFL